ncbi:spermidine synthase [Rurimicrobium arvi]|uniref:Methyltransferase type 11 domain-containing protein n=1 Tax=Rurimicrobium arvi TaxID=2049916 RepID=A0ABP8MVX0_9BACT
MQLSRFQKLLSRFYPVRIYSFEGRTSPQMKLYHFRGRWQLASESALYSDGDHYQPLTKAFAYIRGKLPACRNMLVLGAGLGSAISVWESLKVPLPETLLVDIDEEILRLGRELNNRTNVRWICEDVQNLVRREQGTWDLIVLDIFQDRVVPHFVCTQDFLKNCARMLSTSGTLVFNYIINNEQDWNALQQLTGSLFITETVISIGINRILILKKAADES